MMHAHGGRIEASSGGQGQGSTFVIALPLSDQLPQSETRPPNPLGEMAATLRILVVDDNRDAAISMAALLKTYGHDAEVAYDGAMAVARAKAIQPDVILLDIGLPDLDGYAVARALRALRWVKRPLLIAVTGWGTPSDRERAFDAGFDEHLTKPIDYASLGEIIKAGLRS